MEELFEIINESGKVIGTEKRSIVHQKGLLHKEVDVFVLDNEGKIFVFDSLENAENYRKKLQLGYGCSNTKEPYCSQSIHMKSPLFYSEKSIKIVDSIKKSKKECFLLVRGNTKIDKGRANY